MRTIRRMLVALLLLGSGGLFLGCPDKGAGEKAGETIDRAAQDTKEAGKKAGDAVEHKVDDAREKTE